MSTIKQMRWLALFEGWSLILLVFVAVPFKYLLDIPQLSAIIGPIHGVLFILFVLRAITISIEYDWKFFWTTTLVLVSCLVPFGTFYIDRTILKPLDMDSQTN